MLQRMLSPIPHIIIVAITVTGIVLHYDQVFHGILVKKNMLFPTKFTVSQIKQNYSGCPAVEA